MLLSRSIRTLAAALLLSLSLGTRADAAILLNFGATVSDDNNSPAHQDGTVTGTSWNLVTGDISSGIVTDTGAATGVSLVVGREFSGGTMDWSLKPGNFAGLRSSQKTGIYAGNGGSAMYHSTLGVGVRISGLEAGTYYVYSNGRNTNSGNTTESYRFIALAVDGSSGVTNYDVTDGTVMHNTAAAPTWSEGDNYILHEVALDAGQDLVIVSRGPGGRGFMNTAGIVLIPEPTTAALLGAGGLLVSVRRRWMA